MKRTTESEPQIIALNVPENTKWPDFEQFAYLLSKERLQRLSVFRFDIDKIRSLFTELLIRYLISRNSSYDFLDIEFVKNSFGKPYIKSDQGLCFNASHSGEWVAVAFSRREIGVDVEKVQTIGELELAQRFFSTHELLYLNEARNVEEQRIRFFEIWTLKESYVKWLGTGLNTPLSSFTVCPSTDNHIQPSGIVDTNIRFSLNRIGRNHILSICHNEQIQTSIKIAKITLSEFSSWLNSGDILGKSNLISKMITIS